MHISVYTSTLYPKGKKSYFTEKAYSRRSFQIWSWFSQAVLFFCARASKLVYSLPCLYQLPKSNVLLYLLAQRITKEFQLNLRCLNLYTAIKMISKKICKAIKSLFLPSKVVRKVLQGHMIPHMSPFSHHQERNL